MGEIIPFKRPSQTDKHKGKSLCRSGFHKWLIKKERQFDVKRGKLITLSICSRCNKEKVELL